MPGVKPIHDSPTATISNTYNQEQVMQFVEFFDQEFFRNSVKTWGSALGVTILTVIVLRIIRGVFAAKISKLAQKTVTSLDDLVVDVLRRTKFFFALVVSLYAGSSILTLPSAVVEIAEIIVVLSLLLQVGFWGNAIISFWLNRVVQSKMEQDAAAATTLTALGFLGRLILWSVVLLMALDNVGVNITGLATTIGIGGIAIALAVQNILGDLFASLTIVLDKPFVIGDFIIVDQYLGTVERIGIKTTRIRSLSGEQLIFSNNDLLKSRIRNYKRMFERRVVLEVGITYQTPLEKVKLASRIIRDSIEAQEKARFDRAHFKAFGDSALNYEAVFYVKSPDYNAYMDTQEAINLEIMRRFREEGIEFAFPTRTLFLQHENSGDGEGKEMNALARPGKDPKR